MAYTPRFAESLFGHDDTVIRMGFRVGYDDIFNNIPANMGLNAPYTLTTTQTAGVTQTGKFPWAVGYDQTVPLVSNVGRQGPGTPTSGLLTFNAEDPNLRSAYIYQYSFGIQRRIGGELSLEADYQGSTGHKLGTVCRSEPTACDPARSERTRQSDPERAGFSVSHLRDCHHGGGQRQLQLQRRGVHNEVSRAARHLYSGLVHVRQVA